MTVLGMDVSPCAVTMKAVLLLKYLMLSDTNFKVPQDLNITPNR